MNIISRGAKIFSIDEIELIDNNNNNNNNEKRKMTKQSFEKQLKSNKIRDPHRPIVHRSVFIIPNIIFLLVPGSFILPLDIIDTFHREDVYFSVGKKSWRTKAGNEEG